MKLSVAFNGDHGLIGQLSGFPEVTEIYGKRHRELIGGGRANFTLAPINDKNIAQSIRLAHEHKISFNYLLNASTLNGTEQTRAGQKAIRRILDDLSILGVDAITVSLPLLQKLIHARYPHFKTRIGVFALIDSPLKARQWEDMGADTLCLSALTCNRNFPLLATIRESVRCSLQLIANASCIPGCSHELTHMNMLTNASSSRDKLGGFCMDYCFLHCSSRKLAEPVNYIRSTWIRPEDLSLYESIGYDYFKLVERSCPTPLLLKRVKAYVERSFDGNLLEIAGPVATISKKTGMSLKQMIRMLWTFFRPDLIKPKALLSMKAYAQTLIDGSYNRGSAPVYIDNKKLDGYLKGALKKGCFERCHTCDYCTQWAAKAVDIDKDYREKALTMANDLNNGIIDGSHWFSH